jgi:hypothetical protein
VRADAHLKTRQGVTSDAHTKTQGLTSDAPAYKNTWSPHGCVYVSLPLVFHEHLMSLSGVYMQEHLLSLPVVFMQEHLMSILVFLCEHLMSLPVVFLNEHLLSLPAVFM